MTDFAIDRKRQPSDVAKGGFVVCASGHPLKERDRGKRWVTMRYTEREKAEKGLERATFAGYDALIYAAEAEE